MLHCQTYELGAAQHAIPNLGDSHTPVVLIFPVKADMFSFSTGTPDGRIAIDARPAGPSTLKIGTADDFILSAKSTIINSASFYGLVPDSVPLSSIYDVGIAIYHMFPTDSQNPP